jgi:putative protease
MSKSDTSRIELLAPAGDWACLKAAVLNGADAVYFGLSDFNARRRAANFTPDELPKVIGYLHNHNVKGYVAFNTLVFSGELDAAAQLLKAVADAGSDAVIVQDLGIALLLSRLAPSLPVHASTQMTLTDAAAGNFAASLGIRRAILARELSLVELRQFRANTDIELEVFVHGALCISYGGQCLASLALGGRSANRGLCAQPCRMPYQLVVGGKTILHADKRYMLSTTDLAAHSRIGQMLDSGVCGFKIEGRLKNEYYVAAAVAAYRAALDSAICGREFALSPNQHARLVQGFSRGFTTGFLDGKDHQKLVHGRFPKSRGMYIGTVEAKDKSGITVAFAADDSILLKAGDGVVIDGPGPDDEQGGRIYMVKAAGTNKAVLMFGKDDIYFPAIAVGAAVWKTDDPAVRRQIEQTFNTERVPHHIPITVAVSAKLGLPLNISFADNQSHTASVRWNTPLEPAQNYVLNVDAIREQLGRLGNTPFVLKDIKIEHLDNVMVPRSVLNDLRRKAVEQLLAIRALDAKHIIAEPAALENLRAQIENLSSAASRPQTELSVLVRTIEQFDCALEFARNSRLAVALYCDFDDTDLCRFAAEKARTASVPLGLATLRINKSSDVESLKAILDCKPNTVLVRNLAALAYFRNRAPQLQLVGDFSFNITNELAACVLANWGIKTITPGYDLNIEQLSSLLRATNPAWFEQVIYDHIPMFHTEHCIAANMLSNGKDECTCGRPCKNSIELEDTKSLRYYIVTDAACRGTIYHPTVFCSASHIEALKTIGLRRFRVSLLNEKQAQTKIILESFGQLLTGRIESAQALAAITKATGYKFTAAPLVR